MNRKYLRRFENCRAVCRLRWQRHQAPGRRKTRSQLFRLYESNAGTRTRGNFHREFVTR